MIHKRLALFLLGPRLIDFDTFLPLAMCLKDAHPTLDIRFVTFSNRHLEYIRQNRTLISGVSECGSLHCFPTDSDSGLSRLWNAAIGFLTMSWWVLRGRRPFIFRERAFREGSAARLYILSRLKKGVGVVVIKARMVESCLLPDQKKEFSAKISAPKPGWVDRVIGRCGDAVIQTHDDQELFTQIFAGEFVKHRERILRSGLMTETPVWRDFICKDAKRELALLYDTGHTPAENIYVVLGGKSMQSRWLRTPNSVAHSFHRSLEAIFSHDPSALVLVRPHPAGMDEPFIMKAVDRYGADRVKVNLAHPDVQALLAHRVIFTSPTNIMSTLTLGRRIDCIEYSESYLDEFGPVSPCRRFGVAYANPATADFTQAFGALLDNATFDQMTDGTLDVDFLRRNVANPQALLEDLDSLEARHAE